MMQLSLLNPYYFYQLGAGATGQAPRGRPRPEGVGFTAWAAVTRGARFRAERLGAK
jgi:hypothetical protein